MSALRLKTIQQTLESAFSPVNLHIEDESWKHAGHAGSGEGGHFAVDITAAAFEGKNRLERHRMVYSSLKEAFGPAIHALSIKAKAPGEE